MLRSKESVAKKHYDSQRLSARRRGIEWFFPDDSWKLWWLDHLGADWLNLRGRKSHQYCMAGIGDEGAYEPVNVMCITNTESHRQRTDRVDLSGERNHQSKLKKHQIREIILSKETHLSMANRYGVSRAQVGDIKRGRCWGHLGLAHVQ
jgi:hypothetical protein